MKYMNTEKGTDNKNILYRHSSKNLPVIGTKTRVTICCIIQDGEMRFGFAVCHKSDAKKWVRSTGRIIAQGKALSKKAIVIPLPEDKKKVAETFFDISNELIIKKLFRSKPMEDIMKKLNNRKAILEKQETKLIEESTELANLYEGYKNKKRSRERTNGERVKITS